jgi:hypothetical protein
MNRTVALLLAGLAALTAVPAATGHVTITVDPLDQPLQVGVPTVATLHFSEPCFEMPAEMAAGNDELTAALAATAPAYVNATGETVPWTIEDCDPTAVPFALVRAQAELTLVVDPLAPALTPLSIPVTYVNANGESAEGVPLNVTVAYAWNVTVVSADLTAGQDGVLVVDVTANADTTLLFTGGHGITVPAQVEVPSPLLDGKPTRRIEVPVKAEHAGNGTVTVSAQATGRDAVGAPFALTLAVLPAANATAVGDGHGHEEAGKTDADSKGAPAPAAPIAALALLGLALLRQRER